MHLLFFYYLAILFNPYFDFIRFNNFPELDSYLMWKWLERNLSNRISTHCFGQAIYLSFTCNAEKG